MRLRNKLVTCIIMLCSTCVCICTDTYTIAILHGRISVPWCMLYCAFAIVCVCVRARVRLCVCMREYTCDFPSRNLQSVDLKMFRMCLYNAGTV